MKSAAIDRFEGKYAVLETDNGEIINMEKAKLPKEAKEGDILKVCGDTFLVDREETEKRKQENGNLLKRLTKK